MKSVVAFANGKGGRIVFGIDDDTREIIGIPEESVFREMDAITNAISDSCEPVIIPDVYRADRDSAVNGETGGETNKESDGEANKETGADEETDGETNKETGTDEETGGEISIRDRILNEIINDPVITQKQLSEKIGLSYSGVRYVMKQLQNEEILERVGSTKKGKWIIKK